PEGSAASGMHVAASSRLHELAQAGPSAPVGHPRHQIARAARGGVDHLVSGRTAKNPPTQDEAHWGYGTAAFGGQLLFYLGISMNKGGIQAFGRRRCDL